VVYFLKKYYSVFSLVFNPLKFLVDHLDEVQLTGPEHLADAECELTDMQSSFAIKYLWETESLTQFWASEDYEVSLFTVHFFEIFSDVLNPLGLFM
jgi:hypothetical protein